MQTDLPGGYVDFSRFSALRARAQTDQGEALAQVAEEFEALFVDLMLKAARDAETDGGLFESNEMDTYREMLDQQLALTLARNHDLGIGRALSRQFGPSGPAAPAGEPGVLRFDPARRTPDPLPAPFGFPYAEQPARARAGDTPADRAGFVDTLAPHAGRAAAALGVPPSALIAQAALETGWGRHVIRDAAGNSSHNYFGIKAGAGWDGAVVEVPTTEYVDGRALTVNAAFRAYGSPAEAFEDYVALIGGNPRYADVRETDGSGFASALARSGYATDPRYAQKITAILEAGDADGIWPGE